MTNKKENTHNHKNQLPITTTIINTAYHIKLHIIYVNIITGSTVAAEQR